MVVTRSAAKNRAKLVRERKNVAGCLTTEMIGTGMIEKQGKRHENGHDLRHVAVEMAATMTRNVWAQTW